LEKKTQKIDDFDNVFDEKSKIGKKSDDPFDWDVEGHAKKGSKQQEGPKEFDFDFDSGKQKTKQKPKKQDVADFLDEHKEEIPKQDAFDPFESNPTIGDPSSALADIKFDTEIPPPQVPVQPLTVDPVIENETEEKDNRDPEDLWSKKELFNLNNISKAKQSKLELHKEDNRLSGVYPSLQMTSQMSAPVGGSFPTGFSQPTKIAETKEDKINALESAFGSNFEPTVAPSNPVIVPTPLSQPQAPSAPPNTVSGAKNDDFGDFPTMFSSDPDGFGTFKGFEGDAFGGVQSNFSTDAPAEKPKPKQEKKKDDWFEF
jgi:hypothetical protein